MAVTQPTNHVLAYMSHCVEFLLTNLTSVLFLSIAMNNLIVLMERPELPESFSHIRHYKMRQRSVKTNAIMSTALRFCVCIGLNVSGSITLLDYFFIAIVRNKEKEKCITLYNKVPLVNYVQCN